MIDEGDLDVIDMRIDASKETLIFVGTVASAGPDVTVVLDGDEIAVPVKQSKDFTVAEGVRVILIKAGDDLVIAATFEQVAMLLKVVSQGADPSPVATGDMWHRSDLDRLRVRLATATRNVVTEGVAQPLLATSLQVTQPAGTRMIVETDANQGIGLRRPGETNYRMLLYPNDDPAIYFGNGAGAFPASVHYAASTGVLTITNPGVMTLTAGGGVTGSTISNPTTGTHSGTCTGTHTGPINLGNTGTNDNGARVGAWGQATFTEAIANARLGTINDMVNHLHARIDELQTYIGV